MVKNVDNLLVLFHDRKKKSQKALTALEHIDDDTDKIGVSFVEVDDIKVAASYGVEEFPTLVYFKHGIPSICEQDLTDNEEVRTVFIFLLQPSYFSSFHHFSSPTQYWALAATALLTSPYGGIGYFHDVMLAGPLCSD